MHLSGKGSKISIVNRDRTISSNSSKDDYFLCDYETSKLTGNN